jgi:hypothetical protein
VPVALLIFIWLISGRSDPGAVLENYYFLRWLSYPFILISAILWIFQFTLRPIIIVSGIEKYILIVLIILSISTFLNNSSLRDLFEGVFIYLRYPLFFVLLICNFESYKDFSPFYKGLILIYFLIIVEGISNYWLFDYQHDYTFLTLGHAWGHAVAGIWLSYVFLILSCRYFVLNRVKWQWILFFFLMTFAVFYIASIRSAMLFLPPLLLISWLINKNFLNPKWIAYIGIITILLTVLSALYTHLVCNGLLPLPHWINPQFRLNFIGGIIVELIKRNQLFFGAGPRSMDPGSLVSSGLIFQFFSTQFPTLLRGGTNQFVKALPELGIMGFLFYWFMLLKILTFNIKIWNSAKRHILNKAEKAVCLSFFPIWLHYAALGLFANDLWRFDISSLIFWVMTAQVYLIYRKHSNNKKSYRIYF